MKVYYCSECDQFWLSNEVIFIAKRGAKPACPECGKSCEEVEEDDADQTPKQRLS